MSFIDSILDKAKGKCEAAEVFHIKSENTSCAWSSDKLKLVGAKETSGAALRVIKDGKVGFFATNKTDDTDFIVNTALELAPYGSEFAGELPSEYKSAGGDYFDEKTASLGTEKMIADGNKMIAAVKEKRSDALFEAKISRSTMESTIANSYGARASYRKTSFGGHLFGSVTREGDVLGIYEYDQSSHINGQIDRWASELGRKLVDAEKIVSLKSGNYKTILMPKVCEILGPIRSALNARAVLKDLSPFADKVGEKIFDERITLFDDGLNTETPGGQPVDDEGVTAQKTTLIENGVLKVFINDLHSASKLGVEPTGNGMRGGLSATPRAGYTTLTLAPGTKTLSELIAEIDHGVIIDQVMGAHQASPFSGDFSVNVDCGFVIEDGKIVGRFKDGMLSGNVFKMFSDQLLDTGSEQRYMGFYMAPVVFDGLTVSTG